MGKVVLQFLIARELRKVYPGTTNNNSSVSYRPVFWRLNLNFIEDIIYHVENRWHQSRFPSRYNNLAFNHFGNSLFDHIDSIWKADDSSFQYLDHELSPFICKAVEEATKGTEMVARPGVPVFQASISPTDASDCGNDTVLASENNFSSSEESGTHRIQTPRTPLLHLSILENSSIQDCEPGRHTSLLLEAGERIGSMPTYNKKQLSMTPSRWSCTVLFNGIEAEGQARTSQGAKNEASSKMWKLVQHTSEKALSSSV
jgi:hypothetical protein